MRATRTINATSTCQREHRAAQSTWAEFYQKVLAKFGSGRIEYTAAADDTEVPTSNLYVKLDNGEVLHAGQVVYRKLVMGKGQAAPRTGVNMTYLINDKVFDTNRYAYYKVIQQDWGQGWEDVDTHETNSRYTPKDFKGYQENLRAYRSEQDAPVRAINRKEKRY